MKVDLNKAKSMLEEVFATSGANQVDIKLMTKISIFEDMHGKLFSGFDVIDVQSRLKSLQNPKDVKEEIVVDMPALKLIKGNGRSALLVSAQTAMPLLIKMAKEQGIAIVGIYDSTYNGSLEYFSREIAKQDLIGIVTTNGGPQGVVPFGGKKDIFGTNPLSYAVPTEGSPIAFDAATAQAAYGKIRLAKESGERLPSDTFLTEEGEFTTDPSAAFSVIPFGGYKGYAINMLLEVLTGMLVQARSGLDQTGGQSEIGSLMLAIDPAAFGDIKEFKKSASKLVKDVESVPPIDSNNPVRIPGSRGEALSTEILESGLLEVNEMAWQKFEKYYEQVVNK